LQKQKEVYVKISDFDDWIRTKMDFSLSDRAYNGLQVGSLHKPLRRIAFALDACTHAFSLAKEADLLFVHHGLFWGNSPITDDINMYQRVHQLMHEDLALYAVHLPLDAAPQLGNNAALAAAVDLVDLEPFAKIGLIGNLRQPLLIDDIAQKVFKAYPTQIWSHHNNKITRLAVLSGGGASAPYVQEAIDKGANGYLTGEINHQIYH
jgi:dinuclear metal center YbgI/SA1388 family protein